MGFWGFMIIPPVENFQENRGNGSKNQLRKFRIRKFWMISGEEKGLVYRCCYLESKRLPLVALSYCLMKQLVTLILSLFLSTLVYSQSVPSYVPTNGLVGWWGFNGNALDGSGNGNHGTVNGVTLTTDRFGNVGAFLFSNGKSVNSSTQT